MCQRFRASASRFIKRGSPIAQILNRIRALSLARKFIKEQKMKRKLGFFGLVLSVVLCFAASAFAQQTTGSIQGTVKDSNGAVVPNVTVNIEGVSIGFKRTVQTDSNGFYSADK